MKPKVDDTAYVSKSSVIIGNVKIGKNCGIYPNAVIRGDENSIEIDDGSNVQDCCVMHVDSKHKTKIGKNVSIGHGAIIHGSTIKDNCIVGMNATILNGSEIGKGSIIGANALVTENKRIPPQSLVLGVPGKVLKKDPSFLKMAKENADIYIELSKKHKNNEFVHYKKK